VLWPDTNSTTTSQPPCVNEANELSYRKCLEGSWGAEPDCSYIQPTTLPQCPEGFSEVEDFCYTLIPKAKFPSKCPSRDVIPFASYKGVVTANNIGPVWMPVRRDSSNGLGFLQWIEQSSLYKSYVTDKFYYEGEIKDKDCLLYHNNSYIVAVSCEEEHVGVCAYKKLDQLTNHSCGFDNRCHQSRLTVNSKCFCLGNSTTESQFPKAEFLELYQNNAYHLLTNESCAMALEKTSNGTYIWSNSGQEIDYTYWSTSVVFDDTHLYGALTLDGWILTEEPAPIFLFEKDLVNTEPNLVLFYDYVSISVSISAADGVKWNGSEPLVFCFTNANSSNLISRYDNLTVVVNGSTFFQYEFDPYHYGPGDYWCESFRYADSETLVSNVVSIRDNVTFGPEYVTILRVEYKEEINPLSEDLLKLLETVLFPQLYNDRHLQAYYTFRVMKIVDVVEKDKQVWVNVHFSSSYPFDEDDEYQHLKTLIEGALGAIEEIDVVLIDLLRSDYCLAEVGKLTWPKTKSGVEGSSLECCFRSDGTRVTRLCIDDFVNGARWAPADDNCEIASNTSLSTQLSGLLYNVTSDTLTAVYDVSKNYQQFRSLDVYLVAAIFDKIYSLGVKTDPELFAKIVNNILQVDQDELAQAQLKMRATDLLLKNINSSIASFGHEFEYIFTNFSVILGNVVDINGLVVQRIGGQLVVSKLTSDCGLEEILVMKDLDSAILLSSTLKDQIDDSMISFMFYSNDAFFSESVTMTRNVSKVFGAAVPGLSQAAPILTLHKVNNYTSVGQTCVYWSHSQQTSRGYWMSKQINIVDSSFLLCEYLESSNYALATLATNITEILTDLLQSNAPTSEIIEVLLHVSDKHNKFVSVDVFLVGQILKKVSDDDDIDLKALVQIVSNLQEINSSVLLTSQLETSATDTILYHIDTIIRNSNQSQVLLNSDNFVALVYHLNVTNFSGLVVLDRNQTYQIEILHGDVNTSDLLKYDDFDCAVVLSPDLKSQLDGDTRVVVTLFYKDVLFNQRNPYSGSISKIFGVVLPEIKNYSGPVQVFHKVVDTKNENECAFWSYNQSSGVPGAWKSDSNGEEISSLIECQFWHTTHFALLLLDEDRYEDNLNVLDWMTTVTCALSFFGLSGIILTAVLFKRWRTNTGNQLLLNFAFSVMLLIVVFYVSYNIKEYSEDFVQCITIGVLLHYSVVAQFCWMLVIAFLQFQRFVVVFGETSRYVLLKACLFAWGFPLVPIIFLLSFDKENYVNGNVGLCYPSGYGLYLAVWLPISLAVVMNLVIFMYIMKNVINKKTECSAVGSDDAVYQWRLVVLLFFMLGLTWIFGIFSELDFGVVFVYLFCSTATLQGFIVFLFFIVFNANTRYLYSRAFRRCFYNKYI
jgi:hypothetical protein